MTTSTPQPVAELAPALAGATLQGTELQIGLGQRYRLDALLSRSTWGDIWQATWLQTGSAVTVKTVRADVPAPQRALHCAALAREAEHLRRLASRHIVRYQGAGLWQGEPVLVLERLHESLKDHLARTAQTARAAPALPVPPTARQAPASAPQGIDQAQAMAWVRQAAQGLRTLHRSGRKHLDIKPANLLLTAADAQGRQLLKLADFGACLPLSQMLHPFVGTPGWAAPEQTRPVAQGPGRQAVYATSQASDWYALGQLLHRLLTGHLNPVGRAALARYQRGGLQGFLDPAEPEAAPEAPTATPEGGHASARHAGPMRLVAYLCHVNPAMRARGAAALEV